MRVRIHPHVADLAGSSLVLIGFLLATMVLSAVPAIVHGLARQGAPRTQPAAPPNLNGAGRALS